MSVTPHRNLPWFAFRPNSCFLFFFYILDSIVSYSLSSGPTVIRRGYNMWKELGLGVEKDLHLHWKIGKKNMSVFHSQ